MSIYSATGGLPTTQSSFSGSWKEFEERCIKTKPGAIVEGTVVEVRNHAVQDSTSRFHRFVVVVVDVSGARRRVWDEDGREIVKSEAGQKIVSRGYLHKYDHVQVADPDRLTIDQLNDLILVNGSGKAFEGATQRSQLHPTVANRFEFWGPSSEMKSFEIKAGTQVRLKTKGNSHFIESVARKDQAEGGSGSSGAGAAGIGSRSVAGANYAGENVLGGWGGKIASAKKDDPKEKAPLPQDQLEGVAEEEWED